MGFGLIMAGIGVASSLFGASSSNKQARAEKEAREKQADLDKMAIRINSADAIKNQYQQFDTFLQQQAQVVGSQTAYLEATRVDKRSSLYQETISKQSRDFYGASEQLQENIATIERNERLGLLGIKINQDFGQKTYETQKTRNYLDGLSGTLSSLYFGYQNSTLLQGLFN